MINERSMRPSDILTASNGKTIEVLNTDAEGRLTLADALVYADREVGADEIVDIATLTGACMVSLGDKVCGLWGEDEELCESLREAGEEVGERAWRMPMCVEEYGESIRSKVADLKNMGGKYGGAISAALFLREFVDRESKGEKTQTGEKTKTKWAHLDIAGPVWDNEGGTGATGFGGKLLAQYILNSAKK